MASVTPLRYLSSGTSPDYRLIHQLSMDETALALLVIDPQRNNPLENALRATRPA